MEFKSSNVNPTINAFNPMPLITKDDLYTQLYPEIVEEITRSDDSIITKAIAMGLGEVKSYLNRFDIITMFAAPFNDDFLTSLTIDVVCWHLIKLANPNVNIELFRTSYEDAIKYFEKVQIGKVSPAWPLKANDPATPIDDAGSVEWSSNPKRSWHY